jgi:hypothetical protein
VTPARWPAILALAAALLVGCATRTGAAAPGAAAGAPGWQAMITGADRRRLARLWEAWTRSLTQVAAAGEDAALAALGPLAIADSATINRDASDTMAPAIAGPLPQPGRFRCRMVKLGQRAIAGAGVTTPGADGAPAINPAVPVVSAGAPVPCRIEQRNTGLWFEIDAAGQPQRLGGRLFADGDRMVFLGTTALAGEMGILAYGADPERDAVGALRALGPGHWRLELPWPAWQANLALVEILPE